MKINRLALAIANACLVSVPVYAADVSFQTPDGAWSSGANWLGGAAPGTTDRALIDDGNATTLRSVMSSINPTVQGVSVGTNDQLDLGHGRYLYIDNDSATATLHNDGTINYGYQNNNSTSYWSRMYLGGGNGAQITGSGTINFTQSTTNYLYFRDAGDSLANQGNTINGAGRIDFYGIDNQGTLSNDSAGRTLTIYSRDGGASSGVQNSGTIESTNTNAYVNVYGNAGGVQNTGTIKTTNSGYVSVTAGSSADITNSSQVEADSGTLNLSTSGDVVNTGAITAKNGGLLTADGTNIDNTGGTIEAQSGSTVRIGGALSGGTVTVQDGGTLQVFSNGVIDGNATTLNRVGATTIGGFSGTGTLKNINNANASDTIKAANGAQLHLQNSGTLTNEGTIDLNSTGSYTYLYFDNDMTLSGSGSLTTSGTGSDNRHRFRGNTGTEKLTNAAGHTITVKGYLGENTLEIDNQGLMENDSSGNLYLDPNAAGMTNSGTMRATNGRQLRLENGALTNIGTITTQDANSLVYASNATINNAGGNLSVTSGNDAFLYNSSLDGGTVNVADDGDLTLAGSDATNTTVNIADGGRMLISNTGNTFSGTLNNAATGSVKINNGHDVSATGTINNAGDFHINGGTLNVDDGDLTLQGGGELRLDFDSDVEITAKTAGNRLTNENNTIRGGGRIGVDGKLALTNRGTINADNSNSGTTQLTVYGNAGTVVNEGTMSASDGGNLYIYNGDVDNSGGTLSAGAGSVLQLNASTVDNSSGTVSVADTGVLRLYANAEIQGGSIDIAGSGELEMRGGTLDGDQVTVNRSNTGIIEAASGTSTLRNFHNDDLADGTIRLSSGDLRISGSTELRNKGTIEFTSYRNLYFDEASTTLNNAGEVVMNGGYIRGGTTGNELVNADNTIRGYGNLGNSSLGIRNQGHIESENSTLTIDTATSGTSTGLINEGTMAASSGTYLTIRDGAIDNSAGSITAKDGGRVRIENTTLSDGQVTLQGTGELQLNSGTLDVSGMTLDRGTGDGTIRVYGNSTISGLTNAAGKVVQVDDSDTLNLADAALNNAGTINVGTTNTSYLTTTQAQTELSGGGVVDLGRYGRLQGNNTGQKLVIADQTIQGGGYVGLNNLEVENRATIDANESGHSTYVYNQGNGITNTATGSMKASGGGRLQLQNGSQMTNQGDVAAQSGSYVYNYADIDNTGGTLRSESGGDMRLYSGGDVAGGTIRNEAGGILRVYNGATITGSTVENDGSTFYLSGSITGGTFENKTGRWVTVDGMTGTLGGTINNRSSSVINVGSYDALNLVGGSSVNNEGQILLQGVNSSNGSDLVLSGGDVTLSGGGTLNMSNSVDNRIRGNASADRLVNVDNRIHGQGRIESGLHNQAGGTIEVESSRYMYLSGEGKTNDGLIQSKSGARLYVQSDLNGSGTLGSTGTNSRTYISGANTVNVGTLSAEGGSYTELSSGVDVTAQNVTLSNDGGLRIYSGSTLTADTVTVDGASSSIDHYGWSSDARLVTRNLVHQNGAVMSEAGRGTIRVDGGVFESGRTNFYLWGNGSDIGRIELNDATVNTTYTDLTLASSNGQDGQLQISGTTAVNVSGDTLLNNDGVLEMDGGSYSTGGSFTIKNGGSLFINSGQANADITVVESGATLNMTGGGLKTRELNVNAGGIFSMSGGELEVFDVNASLINVGGRLAPGASPGVTVVAGDYTQLAGGTLEIELGGTTQGTEYDLLDVTGTMNLAGTLEIQWYDGFIASYQSIFDILDWGNIAGTFDTIILPVFNDATLYWDTSNLYITGEIVVASNAVPTPTGILLLLPGLVWLGRRHLIRH